MDETLPKLCQDINKPAMLKYIRQHIGTPYQLKDGDHTLATGFNCRTWAAHLYRLAGFEVNTLTARFGDLKRLRKEFFLVKTAPQFFDVALFIFEEEEEPLASRHIGLMLDDNTFTHCSGSTGGVAVSYLDRYPFTTGFQGFYRYK